MNAILCVAIGSRKFIFFIVLDHGEGLRMSCGECRECPLDFVSGIKMGDAMLLLVVCDSTCFPRFASWSVAPWYFPSLVDFP